MPAKVYDFAKLSIVVHETDIKSVTDLYSTLYVGDRSVDVKACLVFFDVLGYIHVENGKIKATDKGLENIGQQPEEFLNGIVRNSVQFLIQNGYLNLDSIKYDLETSTYSIKKTGILLTMASIRNFLIDAGALQETTNGRYVLTDSLNGLFEKEVIRERKKFTLAQLMKKQEEQEKQGRLAEEFVVSYEKKRLRWGKNAGKVKQISDFDVTAGYDIISCESNDSAKVDRFIEVKSYHNTPSFYWSSNECEKAKDLQDAYYLYLVDIQQYQNKDYCPVIIQNPYEKINADNGEWLVDVASYKLTMI